MSYLSVLVVSNGSKILIWKQITTWMRSATVSSCCFQWFKDTNLKANHNSFWFVLKVLRVVSNGSKILIWKQITTRSPSIRVYKRCFQWFKDTNLKANHNKKWSAHWQNLVVSNGSKILIWKQITTICHKTIKIIWLFPMVQRY